MGDYWLGFLTLPALALVGFGAFWAWIWAGFILEERFGIAFEAKMSRDVDGISDYTLRNDIWWERSFGPVFVGGWYHEAPVYPPTKPRPRRFNRWIGVGRADGPCVMAFRKRDLTPSRGDETTPGVGRGGEGESCGQ